MKKNYSLNRNIQDNIDSDRYYQMLISRDLYKGTSFKVNEWEENTHYFNDANIIDFIYFEGCLLVCKRSHVSSEANKPVLVFDNGNPINVKDNIYWDLAISKGDKGETGVGEKGDKGDKGDPGIGVIAGGQTGQVLAKASDLDYDTVWKTISESGSEIPDLSAEVTSTTSSEVANASVVLEDNIFKFSFDLPKGEPGKNGQDGQNGQDGKDAVTPDWKTYVYKQSDNKPDKPNSTDIIPSGWVDYPNNTGQWWQCIGTVNGETNQVTEWSEVLPVNGRDGVAQDGKWTEMRFAVNNSATEAPSLENSVRTPDGWTTNPPSVESGQFLWMTMAVINPDDTLVDTWSIPVRISGEKGDKGEQGEPGPAGEPGSQGIAGIPGIGIEVRYSIGTKESPIDSAESNPGSNREPAGWTTSVPETDEDNPYLWFIQAKIKYSDNEDTTGQIDGEWSSPHRLSGTNGVDGTIGKKGQIVYPAGIYEVDKAYTTDDNKAPYVLDSYNNGESDVYEYYILNKVGTWKGTEHNNKSPHEDTEGYWVKMESFDAIYSAIGVFSQALVGSAVFSGDYVFSQQGIDSTGASSTSYELFSSENPIGGTFTPNICFNFKTGVGYFNNGSIKFENNKASFGEIVSNIQNPFEGTDRCIIKSESTVKENYNEEQVIDTIDTTIELPDLQIKSSASGGASGDRFGYSSSILMQGYGGTGDRSQITISASGGTNKVSNITLRNINDNSATKIYNGEIVITDDYEEMFPDLEGNRITITPTSIIFKGDDGSEISLTKSMLEALAKLIVQS